MVVEKSELIAAVESVKSEEVSADQWRIRWLEARSARRRAERTLGLLKIPVWVLGTLVLVLLVMLVLQEVIPLGTPRYGYELTLRGQDDGILIGWATLHEGGEYSSKEEALGTFFKGANPVFLECMGSEPYTSLFEGGDVVALVATTPQERCFLAMEEVFGPVAEGLLSR